MRKMQRCARSVCCGNKRDVNYRVPDVRALMRDVDPLRTCRMNASSVAGANVSRKKRCGAAVSVRGAKRGAREGKEVKREAWQRKMRNAVYV